MMCGYLSNAVGWGGGFGFGWIFMLIFWGLVAWAIFALVRGAGGHGCCGNERGKHGRGEKIALDILKERYAKGEINKEEFESKKKDLQ